MLLAANEKGFTAMWYAMELPGLQAVHAMVLVAQEAIKNRVLQPMLAQHTASGCGFVSMMLNKCLSLRNDEGAQLLKVMTDFQSSASPCPAVVMSFCSDKGVSPLSISTRVSNHNVCQCL